MSSSHSTRSTTPMPPPCLTIHIPGQPAHARSASSTSAQAFGIPTYSHRIPPATRRPRPLVLTSTPSSIPGVTQKSPVHSARASSPEWWVGDDSDAEAVAQARVRGPRPMPPGGLPEVRRVASVYHSPAHSSYHSSSPVMLTPVSPVEELAEPAAPSAPVIVRDPLPRTIPSPPYSRQPSTDQPGRAPTNTNPFKRPVPIIGTSSTSTLPLYHSTEDLFARRPSAASLNATSQPHWLDPSHVATTTGPIEPSLGRPETAAQRVRRAWVCPWEALSPKSSKDAQVKETVVDVGYGDEKGSRRRAAEARVAVAVAERKGLLVALAVGFVAMLLLADLIWVNVELIRFKQAGW